MPGDYATRGAGASIRRRATFGSAMWAQGQLGGNGSLIRRMAANYGLGLPRRCAHDFETAGCMWARSIDPVAEYRPFERQRVDHGWLRVPRDPTLPGLQGRYVFADFRIGPYLGAGTRRLWWLLRWTSCINTSINPSSFGVGDDGELYITDYGGGRIMQTRTRPSGGTDPIPDLYFRIPAALIAAGDTTAGLRSGLVPYAINAPFWSDGAAKDRHIGLPDGTAISIDAVQMTGCSRRVRVLVKNFRLNGRLIETRHLMRHPGRRLGRATPMNGTPSRDRSDARAQRQDREHRRAGLDLPRRSRVPGGAIPNIAGVALGPETAQMNREFTYPQTGRTHGQLETFDAIGMFAIRRCRVIRQRCPPWSILTTVAADLGPSGARLPALAIAPIATSPAWTDARQMSTCATRRPWPNMNVCDIVPTGDRSRHQTWRESSRRVKPIAQCWLSV